MKKDSAALLGEERKDGNECYKHHERRHGAHGVVRGNARQGIRNANADGEHGERREGVRGQGDEQKAKTGKQLGARVKAMDKRAPGVVTAKGEGFHYATPPAARATMLSASVLVE